MTDTSHRKEETGGSPVTAQRGPAITDEETFELDAWGGVVRNALTTLFRKYELAEQASPHPKKPFVGGACVLRDHGTRDQILPGRAWGRGHGCAGARVAYLRAADAAA